jgi:hypothetical protein
MFHYATISTGEVEALATIGHVIRMGHVRAIDEVGLKLANGDVAIPAGHCTWTVPHPQSRGAPHCRPSSPTSSYASA